MDSGVQTSEGFHVNFINGAITITTTISIVVSVVVIAAFVVGIRDLLRILTLLVLLLFFLPALILLVYQYCYHFRLLRQTSPLLHHYRYNY